MHKHTRKKSPVLALDCECTKIGSPMKKCFPVWNYQCSQSTIASADDPHEHQNVCKHQSFDAIEFGDSTFGVQFCALLQFRPRRFQPGRSELFLWNTVGCSCSRNVTVQLSSVDESGQADLFNAVSLSALIRVSTSLKIKAE